MDLRAFGISGNACLARGTVDGGPHAVELLLVSCPMKYACHILGVSVDGGQQLPNGINDAGRVFR